LASGGDGRDEQAERLAECLVEYFSGELATDRSDPAFEVDSICGQRGAPLTQVCIHELLDVHGGTSVSSLASRQRVDSSIFDGRSSTAAPTSNSMKA
jgi:hypothetical protein